jgi:DNA polymerase (family 10)
MPDKFEIANLLRETGVLLAVQGGNPFKAKAYITGANALESLSEDIETMIAEDRLTTVPGIGASLSASIKELFADGESKLLKRLREELPPGVIELSQVPGLTLKRIQTLNSALGITSIEQLEAACKAGHVAKLKGFGAKTESTILKGILSYRQNRTKIHLYKAQEISEQLLKHVRSSARLKHIAVAGAVRRWHEVVDEVELVAESANPQTVFSAMQSFPLTTRIEEETDSHITVRLTDGITASCYVTQSFGARLADRSGSEEHVQQLKKLAQTKGFEFTGDALLKNGIAVETKTEEQFFKALGLAVVPPELREGLDELELAEKEDFSSLIQISDIRGMTHCHTTFSDGRNTVLEMALAAEKMGMKYLTITDHSPTAHYAGGVEVERLKEQWSAIEEAQEQVSIKLLRGTECDILADGALDYPDEILSKFDVVIASVHSRFKLDSKQMTKRLINCMRNPHFKIWGHPLGRLLLRRDPIDCDVEAVLDAMAQSPAAMEINGDPFRLDMEPRWARKARERGIKFIISTDAHSTRDYKNLKFGIHQARRAGIRRSDVLNAMNADQFAAFVSPGRTQLPA